MNKERNIVAANQVFLFSLIFEIIGVLSILFVGTLGSELVIYGLLLTFTYFMAIKHKDDISIPVAKPKGKELLICTLISTSGIPIAAILNMLGSLLVRDNNMSTDIRKYPLIVVILIYAIIPAVVEEYVFRGFVLSAYESKGVMAQVFFSSLFFALLHFEMGSVLYSFFYGCIFAVIRLGTKNLSYTVAMHMVFNLLNVGIAYMDLSKVPIWVIITASISLVGLFIWLFITIVRKYSFERKKTDLIRFDMISKEGYAAIGICITVMILLKMVA